MILHCTYCNCMHCNCMHCNCTVLHFIVLCCTALYCTALSYSVLYSTVRCTVLYCAMWCKLLCFTIDIILTVWYRCKYHITLCDSTLYGLWFRTADQMLLLIVRAVTVCKRGLAVVTAATIFLILAQQERRTAFRNCILLLLLLMLLLGGNLLSAAELYDGLLSRLYCYSATRQLALLSLLLLTVPLLFLALCMCLCVCLSLSLSLSLTHTHTHTHTLSLLCPVSPLFTSNSRTLPYITSPHLAISDVQFLLFSILSLPIPYSLLLTFCTSKPPLPRLTHPPSPLLSPLFSVQPSLPIPFLTSPSLPLPSRTPDFSSSLDSTSANRPVKPLGEPA
jgi:hypothetical protein